MMEAIRLGAEGAEAEEHMLDPVPGASSRRNFAVSSVRTGTAITHRFSGEGMEATGFEPQRNSMMVCGRPVQATGLGIFIGSFRCFE